MVLPMIGWLRTYNIRQNLLVRSPQQSKLPYVVNPTTVLLRYPLQGTAQIVVCFVQPDAIAGASVAALVVPQGMSYAKLAGLPSVYGLYGAFAPVLCYAALGTSRHLVMLDSI